MGRFKGRAEDCAVNQVVQIIWPLFIIQACVCLQRCFPTVLSYRNILSYYTCSLISFQILRASQVVYPLKNIDSYSRKVLSSSLYLGHLNYHHVPLLVVIYSSGQPLRTHDPSKCFMLDGHLIQSSLSPGDQPISRIQVWCLYGNLSCQNKVSIYYYHRS